MLVLTRQTGEEIVIDDNIRVVVTSINGGRVRLAISAPRSVRVDRREVHKRRRMGPSADVVNDVPAQEGVRGQDFDTRTSKP